MFNTVGVDRGYVTPASLPVSERIGFRELSKTTSGNCLGDASTNLANPLSLMALICIVLGLAIFAYFKKPCRMAPSTRLPPGEAATRTALLTLGPEFHVLNDLLLPSPGNVPTTQIDHVVISTYGIFCVETKGFSGLILGDDSYRNWRSYQGKSFTEFQNPVHQNKVHLKALGTLVVKAGVRARVESLVSLPNATKIEATSNQAFVGNARAVARQIGKNRNQIMSPSDVDLLVKRLLDANISDPEVREYHNIKVQAHVKKLRRAG